MDCPTEQYDAVPTLNMSLLLNSVDKYDYKTNAANVLVDMREVT